MEIKITDTVQLILSNYDEKDLLTRAITTRPNQTALEIYAKKVVPKNKYEINDEILNILNEFNLSGPPMAIFNYLIELVVDCNKVHSKRVKNALDCYYYAVNNDRELFSQILEGFANSPYYEFKDAEGVIHEGLTEEGVVKFLIFTQDGQNLLKNK